MSIWIFDCDPNKFGSQSRDSSSSIWKSDTHDFNVLRQSHVHTYTFKVSLSAKAYPHDYSDIHLKQVS